MCAIINERGGLFTLLCLLQSYGHWDHGIFFSGQDWDNCIFFFLLFYIWWTQLLFFFFFYLPRFWELHDQRGVDGLKMPANDVAQWPYTCPLGWDNLWPNSTFILIVWLIYSTFRSNGKCMVRYLSYRCFVWPSGFSFVATVTGHNLLVRRLICDYNALRLIHCFIFIGHSCWLLMNELCSLAIP